jgi:hypothetical protein
LNFGISLPQTPFVQIELNHYENTHFSTNSELKNSCILCIYKILLRTVALTHTRRVEPLRGFARRVGGSALLAAYFLNIILYRTSNKHPTVPRDFRSSNHRFSTFAKIRISPFLVAFFMNFIPYTQIYENPQLTQGVFSKASPFLCRNRATHVLFWLPRTASNGTESNFFQYPIFF